METGGKVWAGEGSRVMEEVRIRCGGKEHQGGEKERAWAGVEGTSESVTNG